MLSLIKTKNLLVSSRQQFKLKQLNIFISETPTNKSALLEGLFFLSSGLNLRGTQKTNFIHNKTNYAVIEVLDQNKNTYKILIPKQTKTTVFKNNQKTSPTTTNNELFVFFTNLQTDLFFDSKLQNKWIEHKLKKQYPNYWIEKQQIKKIIKTTKKLTNKNNTTILEKQQIKNNQKQIDLWKHTWKQNTHKLFLLFNQQLQNKTSNYLVSRLFFQIRLKTNWLDGFEFVFTGLQNECLSTQEKQQVLVCLELIIADFFYQEYRKNIIFLIDDFDYLNKNMQNKIWQSVKKIGQIIVTCKTKPTTIGYNVVNINETAIIDLSHDLHTQN